MMRKIKNFTIGGIKQKIFNLVLFTILLMMVAHTAVLLVQSDRLVKLVRNTNESSFGKYRSNLFASPSP